MTKTTRNDFPEIEDIRNDLDSLKTNVVELTRHIQATGADQVHELGTMAQKRAKVLSKAARGEIQKVEKQIKTHPSQSMALAFVAGLTLSMLFGRRGA
jgi:ElaB/YqjD/DUF883 family membrane-anchored ribosome-binding protein